MRESTRFETTGYGTGILLEQALYLAGLGLGHDDLVTELTLVTDDPKAFAAARHALHDRLATTGADVTAVAAARALGDAAQEVSFELAAAAA